MSGDDLRDFVNLKLFPYLHGFKQKATGPNTLEYKIGEIFGEIKNKIQSGYNLREIIDHIDELRFRSQTEKHELSHLYEAKIKNMGNAGRNGGEYYTPRPLIRAMIQVTAPRLGERIPPHGNYQELLSYQKAEVVYDVTFRFCERFLKRGDRTIDQMVQAALSGKQNIAEGSKAARTSKEMEIKLTNVARASLEELLLDYQDYLRVRDWRQWEKDSEEALYARKLGKQTPLTFETFREFCETRSAEVVANIAICLIHQANYLLDQQIKWQEQDFIKEGGMRERMTRVRLENRNKPKKPDKPGGKR